MSFYKRKRYILLFTLIVLVALANSCVTLRKSDRKTLKYFKKEHQTPQIYHDNFEGVKIRYITDKIYDKSLPTIIFVHGSPGSSDNYYKHLLDKDLQQKANLVTIDRLGYGYSDFGNTEPSITKQAELVNFIAQKYKQNKIVLFSWSYGGPIIAKAAIDNPSFAHVFMIAPAVSPNDEKHFWLGYLAKWTLTKWFVPKVFVVAEEEKLAHAEELRKLESQWQNLKTPTTHFHGTKDWLVPYNNMNYFKDKVNDSILNCITIKDGKHIIFFKNYDLIKKELLLVLENLD